MRGMDEVFADELVDGDRQLAGDFAVLARALQAEDTVHHTLDVMCKLAVHAVDGAEHAGITILSGRSYQTPATSDDIPLVVDRIQYETGQGPCVDAIRLQETLHSSDLSTEPRWPAFTARLIAETGIRSMLAYRLFLQADTLGALNLYSTEVDAFPERGRRLGEIFAAHAAVALEAAREHDHIARLQEALASNRRIGAAIGILMCRHTVTEAEAFDLLRRASQNTNRKLHELADEVVLTGHLEP